jgi:hypothetical protein
VKTEAAFTKSRAQFEPLMKSRVAQVVQAQHAEFHGLGISAKSLISRRATVDEDRHYSFASLGRAFQADGRGFSPIEGGLEGGGSVS